MATRHWGPAKAKSNKGRCLARRHCCHSIHCNLITPHLLLDKCELYVDITEESPSPSLSSPVQKTLQYPGFRVKKDVGEFVLDNLCRENNRKEYSDGFSALFDQAKKYENGLG